MSYIYGLQLENGKYYVGRTDNVENRYQQHVRGEGAVWTKIHKPIRIILMVLSTSPMDEDKYTKEFMSKFGIDNVRGGSYVTFELDQHTKEFLQKEIWGSLNYCTNCGQAGHFINNCTTKKDIKPVIFHGGMIIPKSINTNAPTILPGGIIIPNNSNNNNVYPSMLANNAVYPPVQTNVQNKYPPIQTNLPPITKVELCKRCNRTGHKKKDCRAKTKLDGKEIQVKKCSRCGRSGHNKTKCFAKTDIDGKSI